MYLINHFYNCIKSFFVFSMHSILLKLINLFYISKLLFNKFFKNHYQLLKTILYCILIDHMQNIIFTSKHSYLFIIILII